MSDISIRREAAPIAAGLATGGLIAGASYGGHTWLRHSIAAHPEGKLAQRFWQVREGGIGRATLGASVMMAAVGTGVAELDAHDVFLGGSVIPENGVTRTIQSALVGAAMGGAITWTNPIFHGRQLGTPRSMLVNMALGAVIGASVHGVGSLAGIGDD